jgi:cytosine/adenosine deaminase-related metal-dependent hydrolase/SAM-dependent methyltransferase
MPTTARNRRLSAKEAYRRWSAVYDSEPNPMLSLEERFLKRLLSPSEGRNVVDLGCGTGRWLARLAAESPRSLVGLDACEEMLARAEAKLAGGATLLHASCEAVPIATCSADLVLCSFVLGYVRNLPRLVEQIRRIARPEADIFVTDVHPETESRFAWRRGFRDGDQSIDIETERRSLESIVEAFKGQGFRAVSLVEPSFGPPEFRILEHAGKSAEIESLRNCPAIYLLQFRPAPLAERSSPRGGGYLRGLRGARLALGAGEATPAEIEIEDGRIASISSRGNPGCDPETSGGLVHLSGFLVLPGLVNAHDHLEFALFPRLGRGGYRNFLQWAEDIHQSEARSVREHRLIPKNARLWWGGLRNLLCGVTTVCHHNPFVSEVFDHGFPVRVVRDFGWAHSLAFEPNAGARHDATPEGQPFIIHLAEGVDRSMAEELGELDRIGALGSRTVVVHGLALDACAFSLLRQRGAGLIWCPSSNEFLFGRTHSRQTIEEFRLTALGSDSSLTAQGDLLDEMRFASERVAVRAPSLYAQVTSRAARVLRLHRGEGTVRIGAVADMIAIRDRNLWPAETLVESSYRDVELVIVGGRVQLASAGVREKLGEAAEGLEQLDVDGEIRWVRAPLAELFDSARNRLGREISLNGRRLHYGAD